MTGPLRTLTVISGPAAGASMPVTDDVIVVGREDADLTIDDSHLSGRHVSIRATGNGVLIEDLGSTNGTFVNGQRITQAVLVAGNATIRVGSSTIALKQGARPWGAETQVATAAAQPATAPPQGRKRPQGPKGRRGAPKKIVLLLLLVLALGAAAAIVATVVFAGGSSTEKRTFDARLTTLPLGEPTSVQASGILQGEPLGRVEVIFIRRLAPNPTPGGTAVKLTGTMLVIAPSGIIGVDVRGTLRVTRSGGEDVFAKGIPSNGTGDYKDIKGSFTMTGGRPDARSAYGQYRINGTLEY